MDAVAARFKKRLLAVASMWLLFSAAAGAKPSADDLMVVDCLLPGQIRQLARSTTYLSARRPVKTTAFDCRVRNGEYVVEDRASVSTALKVWLTTAEGGDPEAQTTVGEIFERGFGVAPDYQAAAVWYRRAAEAGHSRAQIDLGNLYEKGLGVVQDSKVALDWYRRAAGIDATIELDPTPDVATAIAAHDAMQVDARAQMRAELERLATEVEAARAELAAAQTAQAAEAQHASEIDARAHAQAGTLESMIAARESELAAMRSELAAARTALSAEQTALDAARAAAAAQRDATEEANEATRTARVEAEQRRSELAATGERLAQRELALAQSTREAEALKARVQALEANAAVAARAIADATPRASDVAQGLLAGPEITLIDPVLPQTRGLVKVSVPATLERRSIVGRVTAPAGVLTVAVNDAPTIPNAAGMFMTELAMTKTEAPVSITAIDNQGKRADLAFVLAPASLPATAIAKPTKDPRPSDVEFGAYHALLIGNASYRYMPHLNTPGADVAELDDVLRTRFGFKTTVLHDANRYEILSALNELRGRLTSSDNLLVYYAGHGELDAVNMRGYWLPVDAEPDSTANWISNVAITDILNVIKAKQILLVVDSCYSGTLTRSSIVAQQTTLTEEERATWLKLMAPKRARVVLTSGGLAPVLDAGGGRHSVFAKALLQTLEATDEVTEGQSLYRALAARVAHAAAELEFEQTPQFAPIAHAGHESGDFFLVPRRL